MRILLQVRPYIQSKLLVHYKRTSESEKVRKRTEKGSDKRIESVGGSRVRKVRVRGRASGGRAAGFTGLVGRKAGAFDGGVGRIGGSLALRGRR